MTGAQHVGRSSIDVLPASRRLRALSLLSESFGRLSGSRNVSTVKVAVFNAIAEQHAIAVPVEPVGQNHLAEGAEGNLVHLNG